jgi:hypothetical protein
MPHIVTKYYGHPFAITRENKRICVLTMFVEIKHSTDIESANQLLQTSKRRLTTVVDLHAFCEKYCQRLDELFPDCKYIMATHPESQMLTLDKKELLIPALFIKDRKATFNYVRTENFLIPVWPGMHALLMDMKKR